MSNTTLVMTAFDSRRGSMSGASNFSGFSPMVGTPQSETVEADVQSMITAPITLKNLSINVQTNDVNSGAQSVYSRKNGATGNLIISIPLGSTGVFQDTTNSDSLVSGDKVNWGFATSGSSGGLQVNLAAATMDNSTGATNILGTTDRSGTDVYGLSITRYAALDGLGFMVAGETATQFNIRYATVFSFLDAYVTKNTISATSTIRLRKNTANGNGVVSIGSLATGEFTDKTNSDSLVSGDLVNFQLVTGGAGTNITIEKVQIQSQNTATKDFTMLAADNQASAVAGARTRYSAVAGGLNNGATESQNQMKLTTAFNAKNMFVNVDSNSLSGASIVTTRKNGAAASLSVAIASGATGNFEDLVNSDTYAINDLVNYATVTSGSSAGTVGISLIGTQWALPAAAAAKFFQHSGPLRLGRFNR